MYDFDLAWHLCADFAPYHQLKSFIKSHAIIDTLYTGIVIISYLHLLSLD